MIMTNNFLHVEEKKAVYQHKKTEFISAVRPLITVQRLVGSKALTSYYQS